MNNNYIDNYKDNMTSITKKKVGFTKNKEREALNIHIYNRINELYKNNMIMDECCKDT